MILQGPFAFDPAAPTASGTRALAEAEAVLQSGRPPKAASGDAPGLYVVWSVEGRPAVAGFWLVMGPHYVKDGPDAGVRIAPYAEALLTAAVEGVWWETLRVWRAPGAKGAEANDWRPLVVLEWPPELAARAVVHPPGVPAHVPDDEPATSDSGPGPGWLDTGVQSGPATFVEVETVLASPEDRDPRIPAQRALVSVVQGRLRYDRRSHTGSYAVVPPAALPPPAATRPTTALPAWWAAAAAWSPDLRDAMPADTPRLGGALALSGRTGGASRVGYPIDGWLSRGLDLAPEDTTALAPIALRRREVGSQVVQQAGLALGITLGVLCAVLIGFWLVERATKWEAAAGVAPPAPEAQPGLSICSAEPQRFREEMRCVLQSLSYSTDLWGTGYCGDQRGNAGAGAAAFVSTEDRPDLRATWCGLRDRVLDGEVVFEASQGRAITWAEVAASQACFNALGHPYAYTLPADDPLYDPGATRADPRLFLRRPDTRLQGLVGFVQELDEACDVYRTRMEAQLDGAVFAEHIGKPAPAAGSRAGLDEPQTLRQELVSVASAGLEGDAGRCFRAGVRSGLSDATGFEDLCGGTDELDRRYARNHPAWDALRGEGADTPLLSEYVRARFTRWREGEASSVEPLADTPDLWKCHLTLSESRGHLRPPGADPVRLQWGQSLPVPQRYGEGRTVRKQLTLDAAMHELAARPDLAVGDCWPVVTARLSRYQPVHPLLPTRAEAPWPSTEQQLCDQVCAVRHRITDAREASRWWTPGSDLATCVSTDRPAQPMDDPESWTRPSMDYRLDRLHLPWNGVDARRWRTPRASEVCGFNLVAQGYLDDLGGVLPPQVAAPQWAGDLDGTSGLAGGADGVAMQSAMDMSAYGKARGRTTCASVATQCFVGGMVEVLGDDALLPSAARARWEAWVAGTARYDGSGLEPIAQHSPWCELVAPYISPDGKLPEGELDYPCALGVQEARDRVSAAFVRLSSGGVTAASGEAP